MKQFFFAVALCLAALVSTLLLTSCGNDNQVLPPVLQFSVHEIDQSSLAGTVELYYDKHDYYSNADSSKVYDGSLITKVHATFKSADGKGYIKENNPRINSVALDLFSDNFIHQTSRYFDTDTDPLVLNLGNGKSNTFEKDASELYPAFSHNVSFGKPAQLLNFTPNQVVDKNQDLQLTWEASSNELTEFIVHVFSLVPKGNDDSKPIYSKFYKVQNTNNLTVPKEVLAKCTGSIHQIVLNKKEGVLVPVEVNRALLNKHDTYKVLYIASSSHRTSFIVK